MTFNQVGQNQMTPLIKMANGFLVKSKSSQVEQKNDTPSQDDQWFFN